MLKGIAKLFRERSSVWRSSTVQRWTSNGIPVYQFRISGGRRAFLLFGKKENELIEILEMEQFERDVEEELRPIEEVAPPEPTWFLKQSKKPFKTALSHPARCLTASSRKEIESRAHAEDH